MKKEKNIIEEKKDIKDYSIEKEDQKDWKELANLFILLQK